MEKLTKTMKEACRKRPLDRHPYRVMLAQLQLATSLDSLGSPVATDPAQVYKRGQEACWSGSVTFSPNGRKILCACWSPAVLWDAATATPIGWFGETVLSATFSPEGDQILTGESDHVARIWDVETGDLLRSFEGHTSEITAVAFAPDGNRVLTASQLYSDGGTVRLWETSSGQELLTLEGFTHAVFSPDGKQILTGAFHGPCLWDAETGEFVRRFPPADIYGPFAFSPDGSILVAKGQFEGIVLLDALTGVEIRAFHDQGVLAAAAFSTEGRYLLTVCGPGQAPPTSSDIRLRETANGREVCRFSAGNVHSTCFSPDGQFIVLGGGAADATLWDLRPFLAQPRFIDLAGGHDIEWDLGMLQFSAAVGGPWEDLPVASPLRFTAINEKGFFRVKVEE